MAEKQKIRILFSLTILPFIVTFHSWARQRIGERGCFRSHTVKKVYDIPAPSRDVAYLLLRYNDIFAWYSWLYCTSSVDGVDAFPARLWSGMWTGSEYLRHCDLWQLCWTVVTNRHQVYWIIFFKKIIRKYKWKIVFHVYYTEFKNDSYILMKITKCFLLKNFKPRVYFFTSYRSHKTSQGFFIQIFHKFRQILEKKQVKMIFFMTTIWPWWYESRGRQRQACELARTWWAVKGAGIKHRRCAPTRRTKHTRYAPIRRTKHTRYAPIRRTKHRREAPTRS